jgi:hypothetical protein
VHAIAQRAKKHRENKLRHAQLATLSVSWRDLDAIQTWVVQRRAL